MELEGNWGNWDELGWDWDGTGRELGWNWEAAQPHWSILVWNWDVSTTQR